MIDITNPTPAVLADLSARMATLADGSTVFHDDQGQPIIDTSTAGSPYVDVKGAAAWHRKAHPELWDETAATAAPSQSPATLTDTMRAVRDGSMTMADAQAAIATLTRSSTTGAHVPNTSAPASTTALWVAAKAGDVQALAALKSHLGLSR